MAAHDPFDAHGANLVLYEVCDAILYGGGVSSRRLASLWKRVEWLARFGSRTAGVALLVIANDRSSP